jgi:hypothetical protein
MRTTKQEARVAGRLYFLLGLIAPLGLLYVPGKLVVANDAAATAANYRAHEGLLRLGIGSELVHQVLIVFVVLSLYRLFRTTDEDYAKLLVWFGALLSVPIVFVNVLNEIAALTLAKGPEFLAAFSRTELDALSYLFVRLHSQGITIASIFWGLWLFPFGILVIRSGFIPRFLGWLLLAAGTSYVVDGFTTLALPQLAPFVSPFAMPLAACELPIIFWLLIWGARTPRAGATAAVA